MKWPVIGSLLLLLTASCGHKQEVQRSVLPSEDSIAAALLKKNIEQIKYADPDSALYLLSQVRAIYNRNHYVSGLMDVYFHVSYIYCAVLSDTLTGKKYVDSAWNLSGVQRNEGLRYKAYANYGLYYTLSGNNEKASEYYVKALKAQPIPLDSSFFRNTSSVLASIYDMQGNSEAASNSFEPMVQFMEMQPSSALKVNTFANASNFANKKNAKGRARFKTYLFKAKEVAESIKDTSFNCILFTNLAIYYEDIGMGDSSVFFAQKAIASANQTFKMGNRNAPLEIMIRYYIDHNEYVQAREILHKLESLTDTLVFLAPHLENGYYDLKYRILKHDGNIKGAIAALEKRTEVDDRIFAEAKNEQLLNHEKELKKLAAEKTIAAKNAQIEKQQVYTFYLIIISVLLASFVIMVYLYWRNRRKLETREWQDIQQRKEYESQVKLFEERSRIAEEMHDDLGSTLTSTVMAVELIKQKPGDPVLLAMMDRSANLLSDQINEIIWNMNIKNDNLESLSDYILRFASTFLKQASIILHWEEDLSEQNIPVSGRARRNIFLSVKELINNIVKHADATQVQLYIAHHQGILTIDIEDNGVGMEGSKVNTAGSGNGLLNIRKRIEGLKGVVTWQHQGPGTRVHISVPVKN